MAGFLDYVRSLKSDLERLESSPDLCLIFGNESCDLDSIVSALVYAHFTASKLANESSGAVCLPLLQCHKDDIMFNQEATLLFSILGIDGSDLLYLDDITPKVLSMARKLSLVMVDHNIPTGMFVPHTSSVTMVIDHHHETPESVTHKPGVSTQMEMTGSCASLIAKTVLEDAHYTIEQPIAVSLLSAILLDTADLKAVDRVTGVDEFAVQELSKFMPSSFNRDDHFSNFFKARFDVSALSVKHALQRDYKECVVGPYKIGFSTVPALLSKFLLRPSCNTDFVDFYSTRDLNALIVLGVYIPDSSCNTMQRQIAVFQPQGSNSEFSESIVNFLEECSELECERIDPFPEFCGVLLEQKNSKMSRKQIIPIVSSFVKLTETEYPRSDLSPSNIELHESEPTALTVTTTEQHFPLEPDVTVVNNEEPPESKPVETPAKSPPVEVASKPRPIPEYTSAEELKERRSHRYVSVGGEETIINMDMVKPYKKLIQHAGYIGESRQALVVISACYLPPKSLPNYNHVVHHTFYYVLSVLDQLIVDDYTIVYLHSGAPRNSMPSIRVLHKFYKTIDRRLRKQLSQLLIVHPTFWVKAMLRLAKPIISKKFWRKVCFIPTLQDLSKYVKLDNDYVPAPVAAVDDIIMSHHSTSLKYQSKAETSKQEGV